MTTTLAASFTFGIIYKINLRRRRRRSRKPATASARRGRCRRRRSQKLVHAIGRFAAPAKRAKALVGAREDKLRDRIDLFARCARAHTNNVQIGHLPARADHEIGCGSVCARETIVCLAMRAAQVKIVARARYANSAKSAARLASVSLRARSLARSAVCGPFVLLRARSALVQRTQIGRPTC